MAWRILDRLISESLQTNEVDSEAEVMVVPSFSGFRQGTTCVALISLSGRFLTNYTTIMWHDPDCFALLKNMQLLRPIHQQASDRLRIRVQRYLSEARYSPTISQGAAKI
jgi:hypothetical protein